MLKAKLKSYIDNATKVYQCPDDVRSASSGAYVVSYAMNHRAARMGDKDNGKKLRTKSCRRFGKQAFDRRCRNCLAAQC